MVDTLAADAGISQSTLEEALLSNIQHGRGTSEGEGGW